MEMLRVIYTRFFVDFKAPDADLTGRVCLVTGANTGVGYASIVQLAERKASTIILGVRSVVKGQAAAERLYRDCPSFRGKVEVWELDMGDFASVRAFGERCGAELSRLDIAILDAGLVPIKYTQTVDGWEEGLQVNVLSTGLLGMQLLPPLARTAGIPLAGSSGDGLKPHLCIVASDVHYMASFACRNAHGPLLKAISDQSNFSLLDQYNVTKLLDVYLAREIALLPDARSVVVNSVNPGLCKSELRRSSSIPNLVKYLVDLLAWPSEKGARNYLYAVLSDTTPGAFISCCKERECATLVTSPEGRKLQAKVWGEAKELWESMMLK